MAELNPGLFVTDPTKGMQAGFNYADQIAQSAAKYKAGGQFAQGDYTGAAQTQAQAGDIPQAQATQQFGQQTVQKGIGYIAQALPVFQAVAQQHAHDPDGGAAALGDAFDHIRPEAKASSGVSDQVLDQFRQALVSNPGATIARLQAQVPISYQNVDGTLYGMQGMHATQLVQTPKFSPPVAAGTSIFPENSAAANMAQPQTGGSPAAGGSQPAPVAAPPAAGAGSPPLPSESDVQGFIAKAIPGSIITSGLRTPDHNAAVGGVPDSQHLDGQAVDFVMPRGMTFPQVQQLVAQSGLQPTELLNEGSHVHLAWGPKGGAQVASAAPTSGIQPAFTGAPAFRAPTDAERAQYPGISQMGANGKAEYPPSTLIPTQLDPKAIDQLAQRVIIDGKFPAGYARDKATMAAVTNRIAELKPDGMSDQDFARVMQNNMVGLKAKESGGAQAAKGQIGTAINEGTVNNSINILRSLIPTAASGGQFTDINGLEQFIGRHTNNSNSINFKNAIDSISAEYARVMTGATNGSASSDGARNEAAQRILTGYNSKTLPIVLNQMQAEMRGRSASYKAALDQLTGGSYGGVDVPNNGPQQSASSSGWSNFKAH